MSETQHEAEASVKKPRQGGRRKAYEFPELKALKLESVVATGGSNIGDGIGKKRN